MTEQDAGPAPLFVVLSGPSGAGKDTILQAALARDASLKNVATATTRPPRPGERHGVHYLFLTETEFDAMLAAGEFLEHAQVYGHRSGVPRRAVRDLLQRDGTVIVRTDLQGARTLRRTMPGAVTVCVTVPNRDTLERRLRTRNTDGEADLQQRLAAAAAEMDAADEFDYVLVNRDGREEEAVTALLRLIRAERARPERRPPVV